MTIKVKCDICGSKNLDTQILDNVGVRYICNDCATTCNPLPEGYEWLGKGVLIQKDDINVLDGCEVVHAAIGHTRYYSQYMRKKSSAQIETADNKAKSEKIGSNIEQIHFEALNRIGMIYAEGAEKYGYNNYLKGVGDPEFQKERLRHAIRHLHLWASGDRSEDHLAKVGWFCTAQMEIEHCENIAASKRDGNR